MVRDKSTTLAAAFRRRRPDVNHRDSLWQDLRSRPPVGRCLSGLRELKKQFTGWCLATRGVRPAESRRARERTQYSCEEPLPLPVPDCEGKLRVTTTSNNSDGTRTRNPQIRSLIRYPLRHGVFEERETRSGAPASPAAPCRTRRLLENPAPRAPS